MTYQTLARKYRPQKFSDLVGQDTAALALANAIKLGRPSPAIIFTGVRGVGKTTTARLYAKALNCDQGPTPEPCGLCESCQAISLGTHQDVLEIDGASNNGVDEVRVLQETLEYVPQRSPYKVYIIDEVHMLTQSAFNALLKTLEEPPARVIFVFATTELNRVPKTILSRCQTFHLQKISQESVFKRLAAILAQEGIPFDDDALMLVAREGKGSMRDALTLLDQAIAQGSGRVAREVVEAICPSHSSLQLMGLLEALVQKRAADIIGLIDACDQAGLSMAQLTEELARLARAAFVVRDVGADAVAAQFLHFDRAEMGLLKAVAAQAKPLDLNRIFRFLVQCRHDLDGSELDRFVVENYALEWCLDPGLPDLEQWLAGQGPQVSATARQDVSPGRAPAPLATAPTQTHSLRPSETSSPFADSNGEASANPARKASGGLRQMFQKSIMEQQNGAAAKPEQPSPPSPGPGDQDGIVVSAPSAAASHSSAKASPERGAAPSVATDQIASVNQAMPADRVVNAPGLVGTAKPSGHSPNLTRDKPSTASSSLAPAAESRAPHFAPAAEPVMTLSNLTSAAGEATAASPKINPAEATAALPKLAPAEATAPNIAHAAELMATSANLTSASESRNSASSLMPTSDPIDSPPSLVPTSESIDAPPNLASIAKPNVTSPSLDLEASAFDAVLPIGDVVATHAASPNDKIPMIPVSVSDATSFSKSVVEQGPTKSTGALAKQRIVASSLDEKQAQAPESSRQRAGASRHDKPSADPKAVGEAPANHSAKPGLAAPKEKTFPATWRGLVDAWKAQKPLQARILEEAYLVEYSITNITLATKNASLAAQKLLQPDVQRKISEQFAELFGFTGSLQVVTYSPDLDIKVSPMQVEAASEKPVNHQTLLDIRRDEKAQRREALLEDVRTHPFTKEALACFGGTIESIELTD